MAMPLFMIIMTMLLSAVSLFLGGMLLTWDGQQVMGLLATLDGWPFSVVFTAVVGTFVLLTVLKKLIPGPWLQRTYHHPTLGVLLLVLSGGCLFPVIIIPVLLVTTGHPALRLLIDLDLTSWMALGILACGSVFFARLGFVLVQRSLRVGLRHRMGPPLLRTPVLDRLVLPLVREAFARPALVPAAELVDLLASLQPRHRSLAMLVQQVLAERPESQVRAACFAAMARLAVPSSDGLSLLTRSTTERLSS
jgi:hypothetical protein